MKVLWIKLKKLMVINFFIHKNFNSQKKIMNKFKNCLIIKKMNLMNIKKIIKI